MSTPKVTILVPTYNRGHFLPECLDSVLGQTVPPFQVIVINDGSTDNTREVLAPYMDRIEYIEKENGGKSTALNLALPRVRGDYVWIMDDDDVAIPDALETHLAVLENDPNVGFTYTSGYFGKTGRDGSGIEIISLQPLPDVSNGDFFVRYLQGIFFFHDAMLVRSACYTTLGGFDTECLRCQDVEMTLRLARRFRGRPINRPTIVVRCHSGGRGSEEQSVRLHRKLLAVFSGDARVRAVLEDRIMWGEVEVFTTRGKERLAAGDPQEAREWFEKARALTAKLTLEQRRHPCAPGLLFQAARQLKLLVSIFALRFAPSLTVAALRGRMQTKSVRNR
jgi:glycosyltransferase involved in cell wall biosynthesis